MRHFFVRYECWKNIFFSHILHKKDTIRTYNYVVWKRTYLRGKGDYHETSFK